jgi:hypothetical protein
MVSYLPLKSYILGIHTSISSLTSRSSIRSFHFRSPGSCIKVPANISGAMCYLQAHNIWCISRSAADATLDPLSLDIPVSIFPASSVQQTYQQPCSRCSTAAFVSVHSKQSVSLQVHNTRFLNNPAQLQRFTLCLCRFRPAHFLQVHNTRYIDNSTADATLDPLSLHIPEPARFLQVHNTRYLINPAADATLDPSSLNSFCHVLYM